MDDRRYKLTAENKTSKTLPLPMAFLVQHLKHANDQPYIWNHVTNQYLQVSPVIKGWVIDSMGLPVPKMMVLPAAPEGILTVVQCSYGSTCSTRRCKSRREVWVCVDARSCDSEECSSEVLNTSDADSDGE